MRAHLIVFSLVAVTLVSCGPAPTPCQGCTQGTTCVSVTTSVSSSTTCGIGGNACVACGLGQTCQNGKCETGGTGGGFIGVGGGSAGGTVGGGDAGGSTAGGSTAGGSTAGGSTAGGSTAGGSTAGGSTAGGSTAGGSTAGGSTAGGSTAGGSTAGGSTAGGSTAGGSTAGGSTAGGSTAGGSTAGGSSAGGSTAGGSTAGGSTAGGSAGGAAGCAFGLSLCSGRCVDTRLDAANCNQCGQACSSGQLCSNGTCTNASQAQLVFSEVNGGRSFVELFNGGTATVNLQNYLVQWTTADGGSGSTALPTYQLAPQRFVVLSPRADADAGRLGIVIPTDAPDLALRLLNPGGSGVDFVRLGQSTTTPPTGTSWTGPNAVTPTNPTSQSLVRNLFVPDSDTAADWTLTAIGSPNAVCGRPSLCGTACVEIESSFGNCGGCGNVCSSGQVCRAGRCVAAGGRVLVSEYRLDPVPMVELTNPGPTAVPLAGWRLQVVGTSTFLFTAPAYSLAPGRSVALYGVAGTDDAVSLYAGAPPSGAFTDSSAVTLYDGTTPIDFVRFGTSAVAPPSGVSWFGSNVTYPPVSLADQSLHRKLDQLDSDSNADFIVYNPASPGFVCQPGMSLCSGRCVNTSVNNQNCGGCGTVCPGAQSCSSGRCVGVGQIVLARLSNVVPERFELFNGSGVPVPLDAWSVEWVSDSSTDNFTIPSGTTIAPGGYLTLVEGSGTSTATTLFMGRTITWSTAIAVTLRNATVQGVDFVRTGNSSANPTAPTTWTGVNTPNPSDTADEVLQRSITTPDTNTAADWSLVSPSIFGATCPSGTSLCGSRCVTVASSASDCGTCGNACPDFCRAGICVRNILVRLVGTTANSGRLEVFRNGIWGTVCDDGFNVINANVACRELGFTSAVSFAGQGMGNDPAPASVPINMDDVACVGTEQSLLACSFITSHNCGHPEDVSVTCQ